ncbi:histidine kinase [Streptomyces lancefieldiae]|uniref:Histidine kinase n=1 Tax=Streptomyces lancefieldiae TaxID=3075520 RepID=A0ABU3ANJ9_9ACTN|nr:histidine kinase [Streptomyces sp. DSM 40712]MDT0610441.1 histidine kinase [Streptomyces sp. DSM 40712]
MDTAVEAALPKALHGGWERAVKALDEPKGTAGAGDHRTGRPDTPAGPRHAWATVPARRHSPRRGASHKVRALEDRAAPLEREREQHDQAPAQRERTSLARELHDIVAHSVTVMLIGVRDARDVLPTEPGRG